MSISQTEELTIFAQYNFLGTCIWTVSSEKCFSGKTENVVDLYEPLQFLSCKKRRTLSFNQQCINTNPCFLFPLSNHIVFRMM